MSNNNDILDEEVMEAKEGEFHIDWKRKLTSRKFWLAFCAFVVLILIACGKTTEEAKQVAAIIMAGAAVVAYIVGEGFADAANAGIDDYNFDEIVFTKKGE